MPAETLTEKLYTPYYSHEVFEEVLRTIPITPTYGTIHFLAHGIKEPGHFPHGKEGQRILDEYVRRCKSMGVMPSTELDFVHEDEDGFVPITSNGLRARFGGNDSREAIRAINSGGKHHHIRVHIESRDDYSLLMKFLFGNLLGNGYKIQKASLPIRYEKSPSDPNATCLELVEEDCAPTRESGLYLSLGRKGKEVSETEHQGLINWFYRVSAR